TEPRLARLRAGDRRELRLSTSFRRADGSVYPVELSLTCSREEEPPVLMLLAHDVTALRAAENRLAWISGHDSLTRLPNRSAALEEMARLSRETGGYWVGLLGLGGLREVNADFGYEQGDVLLASIAERLQRALPEARMIARWSSSSFLLLLAQPLSSADGLLAGLSETLELEATSWQPRLSLGLCKGGTSLERSVEAAAALMAQARAAGGGWKSAES
ncbi:MAG: GGDEF domain-containing protein, partial [Oceanococcaceae bacterium]